MIRPMRIVLPTLLLAAGASLSSAQQASNDSRPAATPAVEAAAVPAPVAQPQPAGPTMDRATAGVRLMREPNTGEAANPLPRREPTNQNKAMMIVGGAGILAGAIIGKDPGTIIMVGGAGLGLWGLWKYLE